MASKLVTVIKKLNAVATDKTNRLIQSLMLDYEQRLSLAATGIYGEWSEYSSPVGTAPETPAGISGYEVLSLTSVQLIWQAVSNADTYEVEYTTNINYFDSSTETQSMSVNAIVQRAVVTGLDPGNTYFFRLRAKNNNGESGWTQPVSIIFGKAPAAPTTWSETSTAIVGSDVHLYWVHNSEDGSSQTYAQLELTVNGKTTTVSVRNSTDEDERDKTSSYVFATGSYVEGTTLRWRVRTKGVLDEWGDWSIQREVIIYAQPTLEFGVSGENNWYWDTFNFETDSIYSALGSSGVLLDVLEAFPFYISARARPDTQQAMTYSVVIVANESYETVDRIGNQVYVSAGDQVYSKYFNATTNQLYCMLSAGDLDLENNISYTILASVAMNSGLTADAMAYFTVRWNQDTPIPDAEVTIDGENLSAYIHPYCNDEDGEEVENVTLSVYRREYDGGFVELATDLEAAEGVIITDPHPALDLARYRIVAMSKTTGKIGFHDIPGYPVNEPSIVIQWEEEWKWFNLDEGDEDEIMDPLWSGSMIRLPYNVDVSDKYAQDVAFAEYIGRKHPVSYYGTQLGETASWSTEIPADDTETLFALRRLAIYNGDVYVREPSGSGYWAQIGVSFNQKHLATTIPVSFEIKRVDGGM